MVISKEPYSRISALAIISAVSGLSTGLALMVPPMVLFAVIGLGSGSAALIIAPRYELRGARVAWLGIIASVLFAMAGPILEYAAFHLEAPSGYVRVSFNKATTKDSPEPLDSYVGEKVCLEGFWVDGNPASGEIYFAPRQYTYFGDHIPVVKVELPASATSLPNDRRLAISGTLERISRSDKSVARFKLTQTIVRRSLVRGSWLTL